MSTTILAIETSCDETAMAIVRCSGLEKKDSSIDEQNSIQCDIIAEKIASQIELHRPYGGVFPMLAKREHIKNLPLVYEQLMRSFALAQDDKKIKTNHSIDRIAVTIGPGLEPALWTGITFAQGLADRLRLPLVGINHLEGHIYSNWIEYGTVEFPAIVLVVSGGHTVLLHMTDLHTWKKIGETRDDAVGEVFDKVAKMLGLSYPGGPEIERLAREGNPAAIPFARPMIHDRHFDMSFSGLKTSVLYYVRDQCHVQGKVRPNTINTDCLSLHDKQNICASFQQAAVDVLVCKTMRAAHEFGARSMLLCGGVAANSALREALSCATRETKIHFHVPALHYNTDNAVMIGLASYLGTPHPADQALGDLNL